jgi:hypothetical protein
VRLVFLVVCLLVTTIGAMPSIGGATDPLEITAIVSLSGPGAFLGARQAKTLSILERLANKTGGVKGRAIRFVIEDDQSEPSIAVQLANSVIAKEGSVIIGPTLAAACYAVQGEGWHGKTQPRLTRRRDCDLSTFDEQCPLFMRQRVEFETRQQVGPGVVKKSTRQYGVHKFVIAGVMYSAVNLACETHTSLGRKPAWN